MSSLERSKKKLLLWKKAIAHFSLCFVMGFFIGFAPTGKSSIFPSQVAASNRTQFAAQPLEVSHRTTNVNRSWIAPTPVTKPTRSIVSKQTPKLHVKTGPQLKPRRLVIIVTPTSTKLPFQAVFFRRLANTIRLVPQPLLWIVVEGQKDSTELSKILRKTGIMYRHLVSKENFTNLEAELNHQRNVALKHIEHHRLSGIVHFAGLSYVYDLQFFQQDIEVFGTWPVALLTANRKKVIIEGPVCDSSHIIGWHLRNKNNETDTITPPIHISSFAFNSSILWDPERWGRTSSVQDTSQNSIKFVKQVVLEDEAKLKGVPPENCSKIWVWRLNFHATTISNHKFLTSTQRKNRKDRK